MVNFAPFVGIGRAMERELDERSRKEREQEQYDREEQRHARGSYAKFFENIIQNPQDWPDGADREATKMFLQIVGSPDIKLKDVQNMHQQFIQSTARQKAMKVLGLDRQQPTPSAPTGTGMTGDTPGFQGMDAMRQNPAPLPQPMQTLTGRLTPDELQEREYGILDRRMRMESELERKYAKPQIMQSNSMGIVRVNPYEGSAETLVPGVPTRGDTNRSEIEIATEGMTPEQARAYAQRVLELKHTNQGDTPRSTGGSGKPPRMSMQVFQNPDGSLVQVVTDPYNPDAPPQYRQLDPGVQKVSSEGAKDRKAEFEGMLIDVKNTIDVFSRKGDLGTGYGSNLLYTLRSKGIPGLGQNDPEIVQARSDLAGAASDKLHQLSGAAISPMEMKRLERSIPTDYNLSDPEFKARLESFYNRLQRVYQLRYGPNGIGPSTGPNDTTDVDPDPVGLPQRQQTRTPGVIRPNPVVIPPGANTGQPKPPPAKPGARRRLTAEEAAAKLLP